MLIPTLAFTIAFIGMAYSLIRVHRFYRGAGFSLDKAREEFSRGVMSDRNVQNVFFINKFLLCTWVVKNFKVEATLIKVRHKLMENYIHSQNKSN